MYFNFNKNVLLSLLHGFRPVSHEGLHTSRTLLERNYYDVLKLKKECSTKEIRESFITLAKQFHPDANKNDPRSHARFIELQNAYSVLSSPLKRQDYDSGYSSNYQSGPIRTRSRSSPSDDSYYSKDYERHFSEEYKEYYRRSRQPHEPYSPTGPGGLRITFLLLAFTAVGGLVQFLFLRQDDELNVPKPCQVPYPDPHSNRPFFMRWIYKRSYMEELEKNERATAAYYALKQEMDKRSEEYDIKKLRAAYFKEVKGLVGLHLVPSMIRPDVSPSGQNERKLPSQQVIQEDEKLSVPERKKEDKKPPLPESKQDEKPSLPEK